MEHLSHGACTTITVSNILYNGACPTILEALTLMIQQYKQEQHWITRHALKDVSEEDRQRLDKLDRSLEKIIQCHKDYTAEIDRVERFLFAKWQDSTDEDIARIGEAALAKKYARLAR